MPPRSPLAPETTPVLPPIAGVTLASMACGLRYKDRRDLLLMTFPAHTRVAGVLTQSTTAAAPVDWCRAILPRQRGGALVVNSGNANAFTGGHGDRAVRETAEAAAAAAGCPPEDVYVCSTGVIGETLSADRIVAALPELAAGGTADGWADAARAIMTTDTYPKLATATADFGGRTVTLNGFAKGSGMIAPDMATLLAFLVTDATLPPDILRTLLVEANDRSFNAITVDSDTSTNDTVLLFATGDEPLSPTPGLASDPRLSDFRAALETVMTDLAHQIVRDGEGATKFVAITVTGAENHAAARRIGLAIGNSPLVKTAIAGSDPNWGRIVMAVGKSGEHANRDRLKISIGGLPITDGGGVVAGYVEAPVAAHMQGTDITIAVDVGVGDGTATIWTCDLTHGYIEINADYRS